MLSLTLNVNDAATGGDDGIARGTALGDLQATFSGTETRISDASLASTAVTGNELYGFAPRADAPPAVSGAAQEFIYRLNRARHDPYAYQLEENLPVDLSSVERRPPLAVNDSLFGSAVFHADEMATYNYFGHQSAVTGAWPNKMARDHGYQLPSWWTDDANYIESIAAGYTTPLETMNALIVDAGIDPPGHRNHLLGIDTFNADAREIGTGYSYRDASLYRHYWAIHATHTDSSDSFLTGVVFDDLNENQRYDAGEGLPDVTIRRGTQTVTTNQAGGWSIAVTAGEHSVTVSGAAFVGTANSTVTVGTDNVEIDFTSGQPKGIVNFTEAANTAPTANSGGPYSGAEGGSVRVDASASSDPEQTDSTALTYEWDFDYDGNNFDADSTGVALEFRPSDGPATRTVALRVTDDGGLSDTATTTMEVTNVAPTIVVKGPGTAALGADYTLSLGTITDPGDDTVTQWTVNWGDGLSDTYTAGGNQTHVYQNEGPYTVSVDLTDEDGTHTGAGGLNLTVNPAASTDFLFLEHQSLAAGNLYAPIVTTHEGFLSLQVDAPEPSQSARLRLYDADPVQTPGLTPLAQSTLDEDGNQRIDWTVAAGQAYYLEVFGDNTDFDLRIANLLHHDPSNGSVTVYGTDGNDTFKFNAAASRDVNINGVRYHFNDAQVQSVTFDGGDGDDTVILDDSIGDDTLTAQATHAVFANSDQTPGFIVTVDGFEELQAYARSGGHDEAFLHDSDGKDKFKSEPAENYAKMYGGRMYNRVKFYDVVEAFSSGEKDLARLFGTEGNDVFVGRQDVSWLRTDVFDVGVHNFRQVVGYALEGGRDEATLKDSAMQDEVHLKSHKSEIFDQLTDGDLYKITARRFDIVHADGSEGAEYDKVKMWETTHDNHVEAADNWARMFAQKAEREMIYDILAFEFVKVRASTGGNDTTDITEPLSFELVFEDGWAV